MLRMLLGSSNTKVACSNVIHIRDVFLSHLRCYVVAETLRWSDPQPPRTPKYTVQ